MLFDGKQVYAVNPHLVCLPQIKFALDMNLVTDIEANGQKEPIKVLVISDSRGRWLRCVDGKQRTVILRILNKTIHCIEVDCG